jgi:hypothetical protein
MNDFSELENDLRALRPARPSPVLFERIEEAMAENRTSFAAADAGPKIKWFSRFTEAPYRFGIGLAAAAAAVVLLIARINTDQTRNENTEIAQVSPSSDTKPILPSTPKLGGGGPSFSGTNGVDGSRSSSKFVPSGATRVVYNTRNEGLQFADGSTQPLRRLRYQTQQTWQWRNPSTGASLRVSYPSEEVVLIPVSGQ